MSARSAQTVPAGLNSIPPAPVDRRADYVGAWWNVVNWAEINRRLKA